MACHRVTFTFTFTFIYIYIPCGPDPVMNSSVSMVRITVEKRNMKQGDRLTLVAKCPM